MSIRARCLAQKIFRRVLVIGLLILLGLPGVVRSARADDLKPAFSAVGMISFNRKVPAPPFSLPNLRGQSVSLASLRGKVVFLNFWATWCVPCREEMPAMQSLANAFSKDDFAMLAVSQDATGLKAVRPFVKELNLTFGILLDPDKAVTQKYSVRALPSTYLISREGTILGVTLGPREWNRPEAHALIKAVLNHPSTQNPSTR